MFKVFMLKMFYGIQYHCVMKPIEREISILSLGVLLLTKCHKQVNIHLQPQEEKVTEANIL